MRRARRLGRFILPLCLTPLLTCKESAGPVLADQVLVSGPSTLFVGDVGRFTAAAIGANGDTLSSRPVVWFSGDTTIATVTQTGLVTTHAVGDLGINASADGKVGSALLSVRLGPVASVQVTSTTSDSLFVGDSLQLTVTLRDRTGIVLHDRTVAWATSDSAKASVSSNGLVRTRAVGSFTVTATSEGRAGGVFLNAQSQIATLIMPESVTVGRGHRLVLLADFRSATGTHLARRIVTWHSLNPSVVQVDTSGIVTPQAIGSGTIVVEGYGLADTTVVTVVPEAVASVALQYTGPISPPLDTALLALEATPYDSGGTPAEGNDITWTTADTSIALIAPNPANSWQGVMTVLQPERRMTFTATSGTVSNSLQFTLGYPASRLIIVPDSVLIPVGEADTVFPIVVNPYGRRLGNPTDQFPAIGDTSIAVVESVLPTVIRARRPGRTHLAIRLSNGLADTALIVTSAPGNGRLRWSPDVISLGPYSTAAIILQALDSSGAPSTSPRDVNVITGDATIVAPTTALHPQMMAVETVTVVTQRSGATHLTAGSDSMFASLFVIVDDIPAEEIVISGVPGIVHAGDTLHLSATVRGIDRVPRPYPVTWSAPTPTIATVTDSGVVTAVGVGDAMITARSGQAKGIATFTVQSVGAPTITAISPTTMVPGATVVISGAAFDPDPVANSVLVDSVPTVITSTSDSTLTFVLPGTAAFPCGPTHRARLVVRSGGRLVLDSAMLTVAVSRAVAVGQSIVLSGTDAWCTDLSAGSFYDLIAANTSPDAPAFGQVRIWGSTALATARDAGPAADAPPGVAMPAPAVTFSFDSLRRAATMHRRVLDASRSLAIRAGPAPPLLRASRRLRPALSVNATINDVAEVRIPRLEDPDFCSSYQSVTARIVYAGAHALILEDVAAPLARSMDDYYQAVGQEFDNVMYPKLLEYFGDPLAMDSLLDGNGRIAMLFSPVVNTYGVAGFVVSCDFYPESVAPSSNTGEVLYAQVPTRSGTGFQFYTKDVWRWLTRSVVMHEAKHLTAFAERLSRGAPLEETWLEEGSAVLAEELWSRGIYGTAWKGEATYTQTVWCDVRPTFGQCAGRPYAMFNAYAFLHDYAIRVGTRTPLGPVTVSDATFYGSSWALLRWVIDQRAISEGAFLKALVQDPTRTGVANLESKAGLPFSTLLSQWGYSLFLDSWGVPPPQPVFTFPSWDLQNMFVGMGTDFPADFSGHPFQKISVYPDVPYALNFHPGGWSIYRGVTQILEVGGADGQPLPATLLLQLVRTF